MRRWLVGVQETRCEGREAKDEGLQSGRELEERADIVEGSVDKSFGLQRHGFSLEWTT